MERNLHYTERPKMITSECGAPAEDSEQADVVVEENDVGDCESNTGQSMRKPWAQIFSTIYLFLRINRTLLPVKVLYFNLYGGLVCVLMYLSVFLKQLGLSPQQIGLISGLRPFIGAVSAPGWGILTDKYNVRRCLLLFSLSAWLACFVALYCIPTPERSGVCPTNTTIKFNTRLLTVETQLKKTLSGLRIRDSEVVPDEKNKMENISNFTTEQIGNLVQNIWWVYKPDGLRTVFIICLLIVVGGEVVQSPTTTMVDAGALQTLGRDSVDKFGPQRAWGSVGSAICVFGAGALVSASRRLEVICGIELYFSDYRRVAYVFIAILIIAFISATQLKFKDKKDPEKIELKSPADGMINEAAGQKHSTIAVLKFFWNVHHFSNLASFFYIGVCQGVIWGFLYWHLENLGADQLLMGLDNGIQSLSNFACCFLAPKLTRFLGHIGIMYCGLTAMIVRFILYAVITNPWWVLLVDLLEGVGFTLVWVSMTSYTAVSVPDASLATVQGILHGANHGLGNGLGSLLGGMLIGSLGAVITFLSMAGLSSVMFIMFIVAQKCSKKPESSHFGYEELGKNVRNELNILPS